MIGFPLLLIPLAIYNIIAFLMRDVSFAAPLFTLPLPSGAGWPVTLSDVLLTLGILLLLCEVIKGARPARNISPTICCRCWCSVAPPRNSCCCRNSATRPFSC